MVMAVANAEDVASDGSQIHRAIDLLPLVIHPQEKYIDVACCQLSLLLSASVGGYNKPVNYFRSYVDLWYSLQQPPPLFCFFVEVESQRSPKTI